MTEAETAEDRAEEIKSDFKDEGLSVFDAKDYDLFEDGFDAVRTSGRHSGNRAGGRIILPNKRLAMLWRRSFGVQFTDGAWRAYDDNSRRTGPNQMEHPFAYSNAEIVVNESRSTPRFECYHTHEKMVPPREHYNKVEMFYADMVYRVRMMTGDDSYDLDDLKDDLDLFEDMEFDIGSVDNCSKCNPDIY